MLYWMQPVFHVLLCVGSSACLTLPGVLRHRSECGLRCMQLAREQGDFLLVGLHTDDDVMERRGAHLPIMDLHERSLSVLACRYVNEVIIGESARPTQSSGIDSSGWRP